jgi:subtilisin family serine protease
MKRQGPRHDAAASAARGATAIATVDTAATRDSVTRIETIESPRTTPKSAALEPVCAQELRETGEAAIADYVRRMFFRLPCPATESAPQRAAGPRRREEARESVAVAEAGGAWTVATTPAVSMKDMAMDDVAIYRERSSGLLQVLHHEILLQFAPALDLAARRHFLERHDLLPKYNARLGAAQVVVSPRDPGCRGDALIAFADALNRDPQLVFAAPDFVSQFSRSARRTVADRHSDAQWHLALIGAAEAWTHTRGSHDITIAILDDGVDIDHPELSPNIHRRPVRGDKRDLYGRDFTLGPRAAGHYDPRPKAFDDASNDTLWNDIHGTACAGVAAGTGPRAYGIAPQCRLLPVKIFRALPSAVDPHGEHAMARDSDVAAAIRYAALAAGADILSCAWAGPDRLARALAPAFRDARREGRGGRGTIVVCAAGNHAQKRVAYPASDDSAIAVGASTDADALARYSNTGPELCVVAPSDGGKRAIFTTDVSMPGRGYNPGDDARGGGDGLFCNNFSGTSSSTALVAGLCGLLLSLKPAMTPDDVRAVLTSTAKKIGAASAYKANGHSNRYGHGRIDAAKAVAAAQAWAPAKKTSAKPRAAPKKT